MPDKPDLDSAYNLSSTEDNRRLYADWAETYDSDFADASDYRLPQEVAAAFAEAGGAGPVLDIGAGTGIAGAALAALGIGPIDATDLSEEMLAVAARKGIYARLFAGDLYARLPVDDNTYPGVISSGTFTHGHVGPEALDEVLRIAAPGALIALSVNAAHWEARGFAAACDRLAPSLTSCALRDVPIYGPGNTGSHAQDRAYVVLLRKA